MKKLIILLMLASTLMAQNYPVTGEKFKILYNPSEKGILAETGNITLIYTFDYWNTKPSFGNVPEELFQNVLNPIEEKITKVKMLKNGNQFEAEIEIPESVTLLTYYITDGKNIDFNVNQTYTEYIYGADGKPLKGARFRNVEFLLMGKKPLERQIAELDAELKDYPEHSLSRFVIWNKRMGSKKTLEEITAEKDKAVEYFEKLIEQDKNNFDLYDAYFRVYLGFQECVHVIVNSRTEGVHEKMLELAYRVPEEKRTSLMKRYTDFDERQKNAETFNKEIIGKDALDFEYESLAGKLGKLSDLKGKVVLLDFWGTWCGPCRGEVPTLVKAYNKYKSKGFEIVSISSDRVNNDADLNKFKKFVEENKMSWTHVLDGNDQKIIGQYNVLKYPTLYLIGKDGKFIKDETVLRGELLDKTLAEVLK